MSATPRWSDSSLETPWREDAEQLRYAPPHWSCTRFFVNLQIELLPWPACCPDLSPIENMWSMVAQPLTQITIPAVTPDQLWKRVEAAWSAVPQEHIQSLFESMPRRGSGDLPQWRLLWHLILAGTTLHRSL
ncbi:transposable element Tcb1 transposase [Trichonephila clavipes]|nr:transposable element Tcb1 transposase [Trichonephila clavipes]